MTSMLEPRTAPAWILAAGLALVSLGLVAESRETQNNGQNGQTGQTTTSPLISAGFGTADSNGRMIAVTGVDVTGGSLLYLVDTQSGHLSVYTAQGGTASTSNIKWVGGRNINLDLQVNGWNDKSEFSYTKLQEEFKKNGANATSDSH